MILRTYDTERMSETERVRVLIRLYVYNICDM